jgi:hypothetical protein
MAIDAPPIIHPVLQGDNKVADLRWIDFFNQIFEGDAGTAWTPVFVDMTSTGTPTYAGRYWRIGQNLVWFSITITPATDTTSVVATTYCGNFPLRFSVDSVCFAGTGSGAAQAIGGIRSADNRIYTPAWAAVTTPLTIVGFGVAR